MISRRTARVLAEEFTSAFSYRNGWSQFPVTDRDAVYDFLFDHGYEAWFCNEAKKPLRPRSLKEFIMRLHTGETLASATKGWSLQQRERLGQRYLRNLASDFLKYLRTPEPGLWPERAAQRGRWAGELSATLELDGYMLRDGRLVAPETDVLNVTEETGVLQTLYRELALADEETVFHHLELADEHFMNSRWDDSISNSRKFFEAILREVARKHGEKKGAPLPDTAVEKPVEVRKYLEREGLLEQKERQAVDSTYALLSHTGGHPYMAQNDQARLLRNMALTFCQFVMLRLRGALGL